MKILDGTSAVANELMRAQAKHGPHKSLHEGYAILLEEMDELWDEIKKQNTDPYNIYTEAIQVAAMATEIAIIFGRKSHASDTG